MKTGKITTANKTVLALANAVFYLAFPILDGPVICRDSNSYITADVSREPLYPLFLGALRRMFGETPVPRYGQPLYLFAAVILQSVLAAFAVYALSVCMAGIARSRVEKAVLLAAGTLPQWGVALLNRFAAERRSCYTECIMTEGLGISLFILFIVCLFRFEEEGRRRDLIYTGILIFLCVSLRKQLLVTALTAVGVCLFVQLPRAVRTRKTAACARPWREILQLMLTALAALLCSFLLDAGFNFSRYGIFTPHTGNYMGIDCVLIYTSEAKDAELISDPELRSMFSQIREQAADRKLLYGDAGSDADWVALTEHFSDSYDVIGYDIMNPVFTAYLNRSESADGQNKLRYYRDLDGLEKELRNCLLRQDREKFFNLWLQNIRKGFVNTVLKVGHTANWAALVLYIVFFILLAAQGMRKKDARMQRPVLFALTVVLAVALNAVTVGAVIFPQTRYMIYGMGLFYSAAGYLAVLRAAR